MRDPYEILGVRKGSGKDEIIKRYNILLKKYKSNENDTANREPEEGSLEEINKAYNILMGYETKQQALEADNKSNPVLQKMNIDEKKISNLFYYHKYHALIGIILLIFTVFTIKGCIERVDPDLNLKFVGNFVYEDIDNMKNQIKSSVPEIKEPLIEVIPISANEVSKQQQAYVIKLMTTMAAGEIDVGIFDKENFIKLAKQGAFISLDEFTNKMGIDKKKNSEFIIKLEEENEEHLYGIDMTSNKFMKKSGVSGDEKILAVFAGGSHKEKAIKFMEFVCTQQ